ncbi:MAG: RNA polymerase sigma factor [Solirubrobacteraceae bacterium]
MTDLDSLPPDQRAVLSLVLDRGKSYGEVAEMLGIPESAVRDRAHGALDALGGGPSRADAPRSTPSTPAATSSAPTVPGPRPPLARVSGAGRSPTGSRLGGALLLGGIVVAVVVAVILITSGSGGKSSGSGASTSSSTTGTHTTSTSTSASSGAKPKIDKKITLAAVEPSLKASGEAYVLSEGKRRAFYVTARGLPPSQGFFYAVWLYNSPSSSAPLGRSPTVGADGKLEGGGPLPSNARDYAKIVVSRETSTHATRPTQIVLSGDFALR